jgi:hypothetical protein
MDSTSPDGFSVPQGKNPPPEGNPFAVQQVIKLFLCPSDKSAPVSFNRYKEPVWGPTNYAVCTGTGIAGGGSTKNTDGMFYAGSAVTLHDVKDGTSTTAMLSESILGAGPFGDSVPRPDIVDPTDTYVALPFPQLGPLTTAGCATAPNINYTDLRGFQWASGEIRCASYNHFYGPNSPTPDCMGIDLDFSDLGWRTARSRHQGGVNLAMGDASIRFVGNGIDLGIWQALATRNGGEVVGDF